MKEKKNVSAKLCYSLYIYQYWCRCINAGPLARRQIRHAGGNGVPLHHVVRCVCSMWERKEKNLNLCDNGEILKIERRYSSSERHRKTRKREREKARVSSCSTTAVVTRKNKWNVYSYVRVCWRERQKIKFDRYIQIKL